MLKKLLFTVPAASLFAGGCVAATKEKPNVVFIFADDLAYNCVSNIGDNPVSTPNIDRLRNSGTHFTHAFNQGAYSGAVSIASRAMLNTGKYLWRAVNSLNSTPKFKPGRFWPLDATPYEGHPYEGQDFWSRYMKEAGYQTYITGKWHVAYPAADVFDKAENLRGGMPTQTSECYAYSEKNPKGRKFIEGVEDAWKPYDTSFGGNWSGGKHWAEVQADDAVRYIEQATPSDEPYFMYCAFSTPHDPRQSPKEYVDMYSLEDIKMPESFIPEYPYDDEIGIGVSCRDARLAPFPRTERSVKVNRQEYYAVISHLDAQIGRVLDALEASGEMDNTYIIFTADHGINVGDHGMLGKQNMYDGSMRVPFVISGPGVKKGKEVDDMIYMQDAMATAMEMAGSEQLDEVEFKSVLPLAKGKRKCEASNEYIYGAFSGTQRMVRSEKYKLVIYPTISVVRLFDLENDPHEMTDLAAMPEYKATADKLFTELRRLQIEMDDQLDVTPYYEKFFKK